MKKKNNGVLFITIAIILAILAAGISKVAIDSNLKEVKVWKVSRDKIETRTVLKESMLTVDEIPSSAKHSKAITDINDIVGRAVLTDLYSGQQIISDVLSKNDSQKQFTSRISPNKRAVAIPANKLNSFGGLITNKDRVDLIANFDGLGQNKVSLTKTILYNVPILEVKRVEDTVSLLILELTPRETEIVNFALDNSGNISTALVPYTTNVQDNVRDTTGFIPKTFLELYNYQFVN
jgi:Flp pilus assembly protein CpaB